MNLNEMSASEILRELRNAGVPVDESTSEIELRSLMRKMIGIQSKVETGKSSTEVELQSTSQQQQISQQRQHQDWEQQLHELYDQQQLDKKLEIQSKQKLQMELEVQLLELQIAVETKKRELTRVQVANVGRVAHVSGTKLNLNALEAMCYKFSGSAEQNAWLRDLEKALSLFECEESDKLIAARYMLEGTAKRLIEIKGIYNYQALKDCLLDDYDGHMTNAKIYQQLATKKMKPNETVKQFIMEMEQIASYGQVPEAELVDFVLSGLKYNAALRAACLAVTSMDDLKQIASRWEARASDHEVKNPPNNQRSLTEASAVRCYNCFQYGHYQSACDKPKRPMNSCFVCAEVGHTRHECPKRRRGRTVAMGPVADADVNNMVEPYNNVSISFCNEQGFYVDQAMCALFDTGSPVSFMQRSDVWCPQMIETEKQKTRFRGIGNKRIEVLGKLECQMQFKNKTYVQSFFIIPDEHAIFPLVIGRDLLHKMNIVLKQIRKIKYSTDMLHKLNANSNFKCTIDKKLNICKKCINFEDKYKNELLNTDLMDKISAYDLNVQSVKDFCCAKLVETRSKNEQGSVTEKEKSWRESVKGRATEECREGDIFTKEEILGIVGSQGELENWTDSQRECDQIDTDADLDPNERNSIESVIANCYLNRKNKSKSLSEYAMKIQLTDDRHVYSSPRRLSVKQKCEVQEIIDDLLKQGIIRHSQSPYASPIVLTKKKNGKTRMCVDYRALNSKTLRDHFPLPLIEDCLSYLSGKKFFSTLDLKNGFHQVAMHEDSIHLTAFVTPMGQYEFCFVPFGLVNSPSVFQRYMNMVLKPLIDSGSVMVYLYDIVVATKNMEEHSKVLSKVLQLLSEAGLLLNFEKCKFAYKQLQYLGYCMNQLGVKPNEEHIKAISEYPVPTNVKEVQKAIGLFSYFRRFVPDFSRIAGPLHNLVRKNAVFEWTEECQNAFLVLRQKLTEAPVLSIFDPNRETELHTDASSRNYGAVLLQKQDDNKFHPVAFYSKTTTDAESRYHSFELETLAIVNALERFRSYLDGIPFTIVSDCNSLVLTLEKKLINPRIARWTLGLVDFDFKIRHRKGNEMCHVDALSRAPVVGVVEENEVDINIQIVQSQDPNIVKLRQRLEQEEVEGYELENGLVFRVGKNGPQMYVPKALENSIMQMVHENYGHQGIDKCANQIQKHYWFPLMREKLNTFIQNCLKCIYYSGLPRSNQRNLYSIEKKPIPFDTVHIDHFGPLEGVDSKHRHVLAVVDSFTKFVKLYPVNTGAKESICSLKKYFNSYSRPRRIISDRGTCFTAAEFKKFCDENNIIHVLNSVASPQSNGQVERINRVLKAMLAKITEPWNHSDWSTKLNDVEFAINNTVHTATKETPSKLLFGIEQRGAVVNELTEYLSDTYMQENISLADRRKNAEESIDKAQEKNQKHFDKKHTEARQFKVGELVVIKNVDTTVGKNKKLLPKYKGPYVIRKQLGHDRYVVTDVENCQVTQMPYNGVVDSSRIKKYLNMDNDQHPDITEGNTDEIHECCNESIDDYYTDYEFLDEIDE